MPSVFQGFMQGRQLRQSEEAQKQQGMFQQAQMDAAVRKQNMAEVQSRKKSQMDEIKMGQAAEAHEMKTQRYEWDKDTQSDEQAMQYIGRSYQSIQGLPEDQKGEAYQGLISKSVQEGFLDEDMADNLSVLARDDIAGFEGAVGNILGMEADVPTGDMQVYQKPDGTTEVVNEATKEGQDLLAANKDWVKAPTRQETGTPGSFAPDSEMKKVREDIITTEDNTRNVLGYIDDLQGIIKDNPDANALGGALGRIGTNLIADVSSAARLAGGEAESDANRILIEDIGGYRKTLGDMGVDNARVQSAIIGLAYQAALQANQRVTDADFKAALKEIGGSNSDPKLFSATLSDYRKRAVRRYEDQYSTRRRMYPEANIGDMFSFGVKEKTSEVANKVSSMSLEDLRSFKPTNDDEGRAANKRWKELTGG